MVQLSATRCSCIAVLWVSLVSFTAITLNVASQRVLIVVVHFVIDSVRKLLDQLSYMALCCDGKLCDCTFVFATDDNCYVCSVQNCQFVFRIRVPFSIRFWRTSLHIIYQIALLTYSEYCTERNE